MGLKIWLFVLNVLLTLAESKGIRSGINSSKVKLEEVTLDENKEKPSNGSLGVKACENIVDIGFLLDSSNSIRDDYEKEKLFIEKLATRFGISKNGSHAAVVVFSAENQVKTLIRLDQYYDINEFIQGVSQLPFYGSVTRLDLALKEANEWLFTQEAGARQGVKKLLFLITDGRQNPAYKFGKRLDPSKHADALHAKDIPIYAIGIGNRIKTSELVTIAKFPKNVYTVDNFQQLLDDAFIKLVSEQSCTHRYRKPEGSSESKGAQTKTEEEESRTFTKADGLSENKGAQTTTEEEELRTFTKVQKNATNENSSKYNTSSMNLQDAFANDTPYFEEKRSQKEKENQNLHECSCHCCNDKNSPIYVNIFSGGNNLIIQNNGSRQIRIPEVTNVDNQEKSEENSKERDAQITTSEIAEFLNTITCDRKIEKDVLKLLKRVFSSCKESKVNNKE